MIISAQTYTVREFTRTEEDIAKTLEKLKAIGYDNIQISGFGKYDTGWLKAQLEKNGMSVCATHTPLDRIINDTESVIAQHKALGIPFVGLGYNRFSSVDEVDAFLKSIALAVKKIKDEGLKFLYHNHHYEFIPLDGGVTAMQYMLDKTRPDEVGILADTYWLQYAGVSPVRFIRENAERLDLIHLKDMTLTAEGAQRFCEVYEGNMDFDGILDAAIFASVKYCAVEQDECYGENPFLALERSRKNIYKRRGL